MKIRWTAIAMGGLLITACEPQSPSKNETRVELASQDIDGMEPPGRSILSTGRANHPDSRSLLSEGRIKHVIVEKNPETGRLESREVVLKGPTGLLITTTAISLHKENETRLL